MSIELKAKEVKQADNCKYAIVIYNFFRA